MNKAILEKSYRGGVDHSFTGSVRGFVSQVILNVIPDLIGYRSRVNKTVIIGRVKRTDNLSLIKKEGAEVLGSCVASPRMTDEKEAAGIFGSCVASPRMTVEKGYCHLEPRAIARGCKDLINKCRDCIELTRLKQVRIKLKRDLYGDFACAQPLKMTMIICLVLSLGVVSEAMAKISCVFSNNNAKLTISGEGSYVASACNAENSSSTDDGWEYNLYWRKSVKDINIGNGVTTIGKRAFYNMSGVTSLVIPEGVTSIGSDAFHGMSGVTGELVIPKGVTHIADSAFEGMSGVTSLVIPEGVTYIADSAFYGMSGVTGELKIPEGVTYISSWAFGGMSRVTSLVIPEGVTSIDYDAFYGMSGVTSLTIPDSVNYIGKGAFMNMSGVTGELKIPDSVTYIGKDAFSDMSGVTGALVIPDSVTSIGDGAFWNMSGVTSLTIPDSVNYIGNSAFYGMSGVTSLTIPDNINTTKWNGSAFKNFPTTADIVCLGVKEECYKQLAKYFSDGDPNCPENTDCNCSGTGCFNSNQIHEANAMQCNASGIYYYTGSECIKRPAKGTKITCDHEIKGYVRVGNYCAAPEDSYAKKRYTPAEAAQWLYDDNNTVTLTFKKQ